MKIRDRVAREKHRQLRNVEETKKKELLSWKEQHVNNTMADYYYCLSNVGDAHMAAERENELTEQSNEQQRKNRKIAAMRGQKALQMERLKNVKKNERPVKRKPKASFVHKTVLNVPSKARDEEDDEMLFENDDNQFSSESDDEPENTGPIHDNNDNTLSSPDKSRNEQVDKQNDMVRFSQVSDLIEERRRARKLCDQMLESDTNKPVTFSKSPETSSKTPPKNPPYAPKTIAKSPRPCSKSPQRKPLYAPKSPIQATKSPVQKSPANVKGFMSKNFNSQRNAATNSKKVNTPNKVVKSKNSVASSKFVSPQRREFVPRFIKSPDAKPGILKNKAAPVITETVGTGSPEKVQFYDHFSRYGKEYDALPGMVTRESHPQAINANEAARVQNELDEIRFQQLEELR